MPTEQTSLSSARYELMHGKHSLSPETVETAVALITNRLGYAAPDLGPLSGDHEDANPADYQGTIVLCVGHSREGDAGATAHDGTLEHPWCLKLVDAIAARVRTFAPLLKVEVINQYEGRSYGQAMRWLAKKINALNPLFAVEYHFNAYNGNAEGYENLYWHLSTAGKKLATIHQETHGQHFPDSKNRGIEPLGDQAHERGTLFCKLPKCPSIITEPFFADNPADARAIKEDRSKLIESNVTALLLSVSQFSQ